MIYRNLLIFVLLLSLAGSTIHASYTGSPFSDPKNLPLTGFVMVNGRSFHFFKSTARTQALQDLAFARKRVERALPPGYSVDWNPMTAYYMNPPGLWIVNINQTGYVVKR